MTHVYRTKSGKLIQLESRLNLAEMDDMSLVYCGNEQAAIEVRRANCPIDELLRQTFGIDDER